MSAERAEGEVSGQDLVCSSEWLAPALRIRPRRVPGFRRSTLWVVMALDGKAIFAPDFRFVFLDLMRRAMVEAR